MRTFFVVEATVTDDVEVERAELWVNGSKISESSISPYIFNATIPSAGPATVEVRGYDTKNRMGSDSISVTVDTSCQGPSDCPDNTNCEEGECVPITGGVGDTCVDASDCISGLCLDGATGRFCSQFCDVAASNCPANFDCTPTTGDDGVCVAHAEEEDDDEGGGLCSAGGGSRSGLLLVLLACFGACPIRRRRRS